MQTEAAPTQAPDMHAANVSSANDAVDWSVELPMRGPGGDIMHSIRVEKASDWTHVANPDGSTRMWYMDDPQLSSS